MYGPGDTGPGGGLLGNGNCPWKQRKDLCVHVLDKGNGFEHFFSALGQDLEEVMGNLMDNACKWAKNHVSIAAETENDRLLLIVEDDGPGIPEEELEQVFDRHYRGQNITGKGAGLGLAIVKRLCELYGWSIQFSNREEGGLRAELRFFGI